MGEDAEGRNDEGASDEGTDEKAVSLDALLDREEEAGDAADNGWPSVPLPGSTWARVGLGLLLVVGIAVGAFVVFTQPSQPAPEVDPPKMQSEVYEALAPMGYESVLVDASEHRILVRYEQPANTSTELSYALARDTAALHGNGTDRIVVQAYEDYEPLREWTVPTDVVRGYLNGTVTQAELDEATTVRDL